MRSKQLDKRAQSLAAMGLVTREGSRYYVKTAAARGRQGSYEVWRDETGRVRCSCPEFERLSAEAPAFRCEHILAIKYSLTTNREEQEMNSEVEDQEIAMPAQTEAVPDQAAAPQPAQVVPLAFANLLRAL